MAASPPFYDIGVVLPEVSDRSTAVLMQVPHDRLVLRRARRLAAVARLIPDAVHGRMFDAAINGITASACDDRSLARILRAAIARVRHRSGGVSYVHPTLTPPTCIADLGFAVLWRVHFVAFALPSAPQASTTLGGPLDGDAPTLSRLVRSATHVPTALHLGLTADKYRDADQDVIRRALAAGHDILVSRDRHGLPIGVLSMEYHGIGVHVGVLAVRQEDRGRGLGRALVRAARARAAERGCRVMTLGTPVDGQALGFYERVGGKKVGEATIHVRLFGSCVAP